MICNWSVWLFRPIPGRRTKLECHMVKAQIAECPEFSMNLAQRLDLVRKAEN